MGKKKPETASEMLESLNDFLLGPELDVKNMPTKQVAAYLKKNKTDASQVSRAIRAMLDTARGEVKMNEARQKRLRLQKKLPLSRLSTTVRSALLEKIRALAGSQTAEVYARKFQDATDADLRSLIEDSELLDQLDFDSDEP